jgi:hypothetical protein
MVHVGVDLHKRMSQIAVLTANGELTQHRLLNDLAHLEPFFAQLPTPSPIAIEASGTWWWLVDLLERLGHQPVLSHPKETKAIASARLKNDKVDAQAGVAAPRDLCWYGSTAAVRGRGNRAPPGGCRLRTQVGIAVRVGAAGTRRRRHSG